jgi:transposase
VTNYFFEIDFPDGDDDLRKRGVSKEHRVDPIVAMGLFIDQNGLPVSMSVFPGNTSDSRTLQPTMKEIKEYYGLGRLVVVADKGLNSSSNIDAIVNAGDGFVFSQILKGSKGKRYAGQLFDEAGWQENAAGTYRFKLFEEDYPAKDQTGQSVLRRRKVLLYWNKAEADMARRKRDEKLKKATRSTKNNVYGLKKGVDEYVKEDYVIKGTGEYIGNDEMKIIRTVNTEKAETDSLYDGYFCLITSELDYDEKKMRETYAGLWRIEESFRLLKSDLYARPVFVRKNEHIRAHFLICFVALLILRIVQHRMGQDAISAERIARVLNAATCRVFKGGIVHLDDVGGLIAFKKRINKRGQAVDTLEYSDEDEIALDYKAIQNTFGTDSYSIFQRQEVFNRFLKNISLA